MAAQDNIGRKCKLSQSSECTASRKSLGEQVRRRCNTLSKPGASLGRPCPSCASGFLLQWLGLRSPSLLTAEMLNRFLHFFPQKNTEQLRRYTYHAKKNAILFFCHLSTCPFSKQVNTCTVCKRERPGMMLQQPSPLSSWQLPFLTNSSQAKVSREIWFLGRDRSHFVLAVPHIRSKTATNSPFFYGGS